MEENKNILLGIYVMGIKKRPELANKPCVVNYSVEEKKLTLSINVEESVENIFLDRSRILGARNVVRTIMSQDEFKNTSVNGYDVNVVATAFAGVYGNLVGTLVNQSGLLNRTNSGSVTYTSLNELRITYMNDDNEQRDLVVQTDLNPDEFINLINNN